MRIQRLINHLVLVLVTLSLVGIQHVPVSAATGELSMMSWNVRGSQLSWPEVRNDANLNDTNTIVGKIKQLGVEYIGFQEISLDQANTIAQRLGWGTDAAHVQTAFEHGGTGTFREGIAMVSKYSMTEYTSVKLVPEGRGRKLQQAKIVKDGIAHYVYNTHLASDDFTGEKNNPLDGTLRETQAKFVRDQVTARKNSVNNASAVFVLGGDMNSRAISTNDSGYAYKALAASMKDTWLYKNPGANNPSPGKTMCNEPVRNECGNTVSIRQGDSNNGKPINPTIRIDYFFISTGHESYVKSAITPLPNDSNVQNEYRTFSDHFPYRIILSTVRPPANQAPTARFTWTRQNGANNQVTLDGTGSTDPQGYGTISKWEWSVDGAVLPLTSAKGTVGLGAGTTKTVTLKVTDNGGLSHSVPQTLSLPNRKPSMGAYTPNGVVVPSTRPTLTASATDPDGDALNYYFTVLTTSGQQVADSGQSGSSWTVPASRLDPGTKYNWTVRARDAGDLEDSRSGSFTVAMLPTSADVTTTSSGNGYWIVDTYGDVYTYGDAGFFGTLHQAGVYVSNITGLVRTPDSGGYWLVGADGGVYSFGNARFYGSMGGQHINAPVVGMAATKSGQGYWLVGADGGVFAFGNAGFYGSMGGSPLNAPIVALSPTASGNGYWMAAKDGGIFAFGDAPFYGSLGGQHLNYPVVDMDSMPDGQGYWMTAQDGGVFAYGNAGFYGSMAGNPLNGRITGMAVTSTGKGYWLNGCDGGIFAFGDAPFYGSNPTYMCGGIQ